VEVDAYISKGKIRVMRIHTITESMHASLIGPSKRSGHL
jgi:hypothetical protein